MALAFDAAAGSTAGSGSRTWSHTCTGTDRLLIVNGFSGSSTDVITATYGGVAMTEITSQLQGGNGKETIFYMINPPAGTANVVVSFVNVANHEGISSSYTGAHQSTQPNVYSSGVNGGATAFSLTSTPTLTNCWLVMAAQNEQGLVTTAGSGTTQRVQAPGFYATSMLDSNGIVSGATTLNVSVSTSSRWIGIIIAIAATDSVVATGIKTINGLAKASVKTINGLAIASVKTTNGLA